MAEGIGISLTFGHYFFYVRMCAVRYMFSWNHSTSEV